MASSRTLAAPVEVSWQCRGPAARDRGSILRCAARLTPYVAETIADDARRAGRGAHLELTIAPDLGAIVLAPLLARLAPLARLGVQVQLRRASPAAAA